MKSQSHKVFFLTFFILLWFSFGWPQVFDFRSSNEVYAAQLQSIIQTGTTTIAAGSASNTATITSVDTTKAFLVFGVSENTADPQYGQISGQITNATTLTFTRATASSSPAVTVKWYVAEFSSGVTVQRGAATMTSLATVNVTLTTVNTTKAFPLISLRTTGTTYNDNDFVRARITSSTNLELTMVSAGDAGSAIVEWQVVEYQDCSVQSGDVTFATGDSSKTATVTSVDTTKSLLIYNYSSATGTSTNIGQKLVRGVITDATTLTFDRNSTGQAINLTWFLVTFSDNTTVQGGSQNFTTSDTQVNVTITSVDLGLAIAVGGGDYLRGGRSAYTTNDNAGVGWFTLDLTSGTNLQITRGVTGTSTADVGWFVVQFAPGYFGYRRQITILDSMTPASCSGNLSNFPVLISLSDKSWLRTRANGGNVYHPNGYDIIFRASDGLTQLNHEVESYDGTTGTLVAWVKIPTLTYNGNTNIYIYYGNSAITSPTETPTDVWDDGGYNYYKGVWHLHDDLEDSTSNNNDGTNNGSTNATGIVADGQDFDGTSNYVQVADSASLRISNYITVEAWVNPDTVGIWETIVSKMTGTQEDLYIVFDDSGSSLYVGLAGVYSDWDTGVSFSAGSWQHVAVTYDGSNIQVYRNGVNSATQAATGALSLGTNSNPLYMGYNTGWTNELLNGKLDEIRISNVARSPCWIQTGYNNQSGPAKHITLGSEMTVKTGSYTGDGLDNKQITGLGFQPDIVIIKGNAAYNPVCRTSSMPANNAKDLGTTALALESNLIKSLDADGFTIGTDARVNLSSTVYYWVAFKAGAGELKVSSYPGTGVAQSITGVGFQPEWVVVMSSAANLSRHRSASMTNTAFFSATANAATGITALETDGFQVDTDATVNTNGTTYHYFAFNKILGKMNEGSYTGNATDNRDITGVGFQPEYAIVKSALANSGVAHPASLSGDSSLHFVATANLANAIQALQTDGFQIGTNSRVNTSGTTYYWMAFGPSVPIGSEESPAPTAVKLTSFTATEYSQGVLLKWKTGYEVDNLGFHVYREENRQLVRLTPEPVAGSALLAGSRTALTAGHHYHWWDSSLSPQSSLSPHHSSLSTVRYWLKDIDLSGKQTWHGPVTPLFSREPLPKKLRPELLSEVGLRLQERYRDYWRVQDLREKLATKGRGASSRHGFRTENKFPLRTGLTSLEGGGFHRQPDPSANTVQWFLANRPAVKLSIREEGWYRVSQRELVAAGLPSKVNSRYLQLFVDGREQPIRVIGGRDGRFGPRDAIEFYGAGLDTPSTDTRVYWLLEGLRPGKRVEEHRSQGGQVSSLSFPYAVEKKDRTIYFAALKNGDEENFFGPVIYQGRVDQLLEVKHLDPAFSEDGFLEVALQGATSGPHRVKVYLNESEVGEIVFEGQAKGFLQVEVPQSMLDEGENLVSLVAQGGEQDVSVLDYIRLTYWHTYAADDNALKFTAIGGGHLSLSGFSHPRIRVFDITEPRDVMEVIGKVRSQEGGYGISFRVPGYEQKTLLALTVEKTKGPEGIVPNRPSSWHQSRDGYDFVIITHRDFFNNLQPLKTLRESQGLKVALIDIEDIYDEFSFGAKSPKAMKDFLSLAKTKWKKSPRFVLLVGDASFDPRNYLGYGDFDFVPTKLIDTAYLETASDDWFVDFNSDGLQEMAIGRLPVRTVEEASIVVSKIVGYESASRTNEALLVADRNDGFDFEGASEEIRSLLPTYVTVRKIYRNQFGSDTLMKEELLRGINRGPLLVNFIGHGSVEIWRGYVLTSEDAEDLINGFHLPFFVSMTCLNGFFQDPYAEPLGEALLKAKGGGALAVWASSGLTEPDKQTLMNKELIRLLFGSDPITLGEATAKAKASVRDQDIRRTWILFGDPATRLQW